MYFDYDIFIASIVCTFSFDADRKGIYYILLLIERVALVVEMLS